MTHRQLRRRYALLKDCSTAEARGFALENLPPTKAALACVSAAVQRELHSFHALAGRRHGSTPADATPTVDYEDGRAARNYRVAAMLTGSLEGLVGAYLMANLLVLPELVSVAVALLITAACTYLSKSIFEGLRDNRHPRTSRERTVLWARVLGALSLLTIVGFLTARVASDAAWLLPFSLTMASVFLAPTSGACAVASAEYDAVNVHARRYLKLVDLERDHEWLVGALTEATASSGSGKLLAAERAGEDGAAHVADAPLADGDAPISGAPINGAAVVAATCSLVLLTALLAPPSALAASTPTDVVIAPDGSGSMDVEAYARAIRWVDVNLNAILVRLGPTVKRVAVSIWATEMDVARGVDFKELPALVTPTPQAYEPRTEAERLLKDRRRRARLELASRCLGDLRASTDQYLANLDQVLEPIHRSLQAFDPALARRATCIDAVLQDALRVAERWTLVLSDGIAVRCGTEPAAIAAANQKSGAVTLVLLPTRADDHALQRMDRVEQQLRARYPTLQIVRGGELATWSWLPAAPAAQAEDACSPLTGASF